MTYPSRPLPRQRSVVSLVVLLAVCLLAVGLVATAGAADADLESEETFWEGQQLHVEDDGANEDVTYELHSIDPETDETNFESQLTLESDGDTASTTIDTENRVGAFVLLDEDGEMVVIDEDGEIGDTTTNLNDALWEIRFDTVDATFADDSLEPGETTTLEIDSARADVASAHSDYNVNVSADGLDDDLHEIFDHEDGFDVGDSHDDENGVIELENADGISEPDFEDIDRGEYTFTFEVTDSTAVASASIDLEDEPPEGEREFVDAAAEHPRGDSFNVSVELEETDEAVFRVGSLDDVGYEVGLVLEDENDYEELDVTINSHAAGHEDTHDGAGAYDTFEANQSDVSLEVAYVAIGQDNPIAVNDDLLESFEGIDDTDLDALDTDGTVTAAEATHPDAFEDRLEASIYELAVGDEFAVADDGFGIDDRDDTASFTLEEYTPPGEVTTHTAPGETEIDDRDSLEDATVTETNVIAADDHRLLAVEDFGLTGFFDAHEFEDGDEIGDELADEDVFLEIEQTDLGANQDDRVWNTSGDADYELAVAVLAAESYDGEYLLLEIDDGPDEALEPGEYEWTFTIAEDNDYVDADIEITDALELEERELELDSHEEVGNASSATLGGETTIAPGSEIELSVFVDDRFAESHTVDVEHDRTFGAEFDLSEYPAGSEIEIEAEDVDGGLEDSLEGVLVDADRMAPASFEGTTAFGPAEPTAGEEVTLSATVENVGEERGSVVAELVFDGETRIDETLEITGGDDRTVETTAGELEAGDYEWELRLDGETAEGGTLAVADDTPDDDATEEDEPIEDDADDDDEGDGMPGFGVATALVALVSATAVALRRR